MVQFPDELPRGRSRRRPHHLPQVIASGPETFESNLVNFEFWLNLTGNLTENRNRLKLNYKKIWYFFKFPRQAQNLIYIVAVRPVFFHANCKLIFYNLILNGFDFRLSFRSNLTRIQS